MKKLGAAVLLLTFLITACGDFSLITDPDEKPPTHRGSISSSTGEEFELLGWFTLHSETGELRRIELQWGVDNFALLLHCSLENGNLGCMENNAAQLDNELLTAEFTGAFGSGAWLGTYELKTIVEEGVTPDIVDAGEFNLTQVAAD